MGVRDMNEYGKRVAKKMENFMDEPNSVDREIIDIQNAIEGYEVRGALASGVKKTFDKSKSAEDRSNEAYDITQNLLDESFDTSKINQNFERRLDEEIRNLQPDWTGFKDDIGDKLLTIDTEKAGLNYIRDKTLSELNKDKTSTILAKDSFVRESGPLGKAESGQEWENLIGGMVINQYRAESPTQGSYDVSVINTEKSDGEISVVVRNFNKNPRIIFRASDNRNYWYVRMSSELIGIYKFEDAISTAGEVRNYNLSTSEGSLFKVIISGKNMKVYINTTLVIDYTTTSDFNLNETKHGIGSSNDSGAKFNRFEFKDWERVTHPNNLIASVDNMLVSYDGKSLYLSTDGGLSYQRSFSIPNVEIIKYIHLFSDGKVLFADHQKVYYSHDWKTYHEAVVYDYDGLLLNPDEYDNFSCYKNGTVKKIINGVELAVWGNYSTKSDVQFSDRIKVWYTSDYGVTVKCCYVFNTPDTLPARHIHAIDFNPFDNTFWLQTGDEPVGGIDMSHWVKGIYDLGADEWSWEQFASGLNFKTTNMIFHENGYVYWSWDKTPGGAVRAPIATMKDVSTHELLFETNKDCHFLIIGPRGDIAIFQTAWGGSELPRTFYYAPDGENFVRILGEMPFRFNDVNDSQYQTYWPINSNGKILAGIQSLSQQNIRDWDRKPSIFIDDIIRENGFPNAFRG